MKIIFATVCIFITLSLKAQNENSNDRAQKVKYNQILLTEKITKRFKDSLDLSKEETKAIYKITLDLFHLKEEARRQSSGNDSLGLKLQRIENSRDSLYRQVIPNEKFLLYKTKKRKIISNN